MSSTKPRGRGQRSSWRKRRAGSRGRARGQGLGAAGKFALAEKSARWGNFHPAHKGRRGSGENSLPSRWGKVICACKCLEPSDSRRLLGPSLGERLHPADSSVHAELRPELARAAVCQLPSPGKRTTLKWSSAAQTGCPSQALWGTRDQTWTNGSSGYQMSEKQTPY